MASNSYYEENEREQDTDTAELDERAFKFSNLITRHKYAELSELSFRGECLNLGAIGGEYIIIFTTIYLLQVFWNPIIFVFGVILIGTRQHALLILMHEGAHCRLFKSRKINNFVSHVLLAWPFLVSFPNYKSSHFAHHKFPNTNQDPSWVNKSGSDWQFPMPFHRLMLVLIKDLVGFGIFNGLRTLVRFNSEAYDKITDNNQSKNYLPLLRLLFYTAIVLYISLFGEWELFLLYWILPFITVVKTLDRWRTLSDHSALEYEHTFSQARTVISSGIERFFFAPYNVGYHIEHHLYPSVPWHRLPELHQVCLNSQEFRKYAHLTFGYQKVFFECIN